MSDLATLLAVGAAFFVVTASPGPGNLAGASVAMAHGRRAGFTFAAGLASGLIFWGFVAALGLGAVLQTSIWALMALKLGGGLYLLWLAWGAARSAARPVAPNLDRTTAEGRAQGRWYLRGLILNLSNPKAVLAWMAAFSVGVGPADGLGMVVAATGLCIGLTLINAATWAWVFSTGGAMAFYARARRWIDAGVAVFLATAGGALIRSAFAR